MVAAGCGEAGSDQDDPSAGEGQPREGGTLIAAAEQEPPCLDPIGVCANAAWGEWAGNFHIIPRPFDLTDFEYQPNPIMDGEPQLEIGPPQVVTYKFKEDAKWSDGEPITSEDLKWTFEEIMNGEEVRVTVGYDQIEKVETPDPQTAVVTFAEPYAAWKDLFGLDSNGILPKHILEGQDRQAATNDGFDWSGGPWMLEAWNKGQDLTLVPNPEWIGEGPHLDKVVFRFIEDTSAEMQAFRTGQVAIMAPQQQIGMEEQLSSLPNAEVLTSSEATNFEMLWFNTTKAPLNSLNLRKAIAYAVDREAIVERISRPLDPEAEVLQSVAVPGSKYYSDAFSIYQPDPAKVEEFMTADGYTKGPDGFWAKGGKRATVEVNTTAGNQGRELIEQMVQSQLRENGIELTIRNNTPQTLFGEWLPTAQHMIGMYAWSTTVDPTFCDLFCSEQIPTDENGRTGNNYTYLASEELDRLWRASEQELDEDKLVDVVAQANAQLAEELPVLPLYVKVETVAYDSTALSGPIKTDPTLKTFWNMYQWSLTE